MNNEMKSGNLFRKSSPILFCLCAIVFAGIGIITFRDYSDGTWLCRTNWFWCRLLWFEAIFALFWFSIFGHPFSRLQQKRRMTGGTYAIAATICLRASLVSFAVWGIGSFVPTDTRFAVLPIGVQLLVALYYGVVAFMFPKTQPLQTDGMIRPSQLGLQNPSELAGMLERIERNLEDNENSATIKRLKERIRYSLPSVGRIAANDSYRRLVASVDQLTNKYSIDIAKTCEDMEELVCQIIVSCKQ